MPGWAGEFGATTWAQFFLKFAASHPAVTVVDARDEQAAPYGRQHDGGQGPSARRSRAPANDRLRGGAAVGVTRRPAPSAIALEGPLGAASAGGTARRSGRPRGCRVSRASDRGVCLPQLSSQPAVQTNEADHHGRSRRGDVPRRRARDMPRCETTSRARSHASPAMRIARVSSRISSARWATSWEGQAAAERTLRATEVAAALGVRPSASGAGSDEAVAQDLAAAAPPLPNP